MNTKRLRSLQSACDTWPNKLLFYRKRWTTFARASLAHLCLPSRFNHLPWAVSLICWMSSTAFSLFKSGNFRDVNMFLPKNQMYCIIQSTRHWELQGRGGEAATEGVFAWRQQQGEQCGGEGTRRGLVACNADVHVTHRVELSTPRLLSAHRLNRLC